MINVKNIASKIKANSKCLPINKIELEEALDLLIHQVLFPTFDCDVEKIALKLETFRTILLQNINALLKDETQTNDVVNAFLEKLPQVHKGLLADAQVFYENDPASNCVEEVILAYPGFYALIIYRLSHELYQLNTPIIPRLFSEYAHAKVGIDINPGAKIGEHFYIDHGTGIVIGETTVIGNNVKIYQGVTLGAIFVKKSLSRQKRHPTIEDNVVIYSGATILGGDTVVGHNSIIGGNVWLTKSVSPYTKVIQNSGIIIRSADS